ncbi:unnamed protein product [Meganyctiphanes norvegica]|uniref:Uncharacterized protein n=1 Tax=Meganyctiphanes norvegica TaxID=48144 RepID=A0AAV2PN87_MEGNR
MLAHTLVVFSLVATSTLADFRNDFVTGYGFTKIMTNCFGDAHYYGILRKIAEAGRWCQQEPVHIPEVKVHTKKDYYVKTVIPVVPAAHYPQVAAHPVTYNTPLTYHQVPYAAVKPQHHEPIITAADVSGLIEITKARVSNLTCTLRKLGKVDDYYNINIQHSVEAVLAQPHLSYSLKHDLIQGFQQCEAFTKCLPLEYSDSVVPPPAIKRILAYLKCEKKNRLISCMKEDLKRHIYDIDISPIKELHPHETDDQTIERALFVLYGAETDSFELK